MSKSVIISNEVPEHQVEAFHRTIQEFFAKAHGGRTSAQRAAEVRATDKDAGLNSLVHLAALAERDTGQAGIVARFLAGLYNGTAFPFDMTELRGLDEDLFEHCLAVLRLDNTPAVEIHKYFPDGEKRFQRIIEDWNLANRPANSPLPVRGDFFNAGFRTYWYAPGYRHITLVVSLEGNGKSDQSVELRFNAADTVNIADAIRDVHRSAWRDGPPIDVKEGERLPPWCKPQ